MQLDPGAPVKHTPTGLGVVVEGHVRVYVAEGERQVTVYYARPGDTLGLCNVCGNALKLQAQALAPTTLFAFSNRGLRELARRCAPLAFTLAQESASRLTDLLDEVSLLTFRSVRHRLARHLLDLASSNGSELTAFVTQQELADATGSVREVIARELKALEGEGWIRRERTGVVILDAAGPRRIRSRNGKSRFAPIASVAPICLLRTTVTRSAPPR